jgi:hypothetical protein
MATSRSESATRRAIHRGECGPYCRIGRRLAIRRSAFLEALAQRETLPAPASAHERPFLRVFDREGGQS